MLFNKVALSILLFAFLILAPTVTLAQLNLDAAFSPNVTDSPGQGLINLPLPDGKILVGGNFHLADGVAIRNLARLNADGSLTLRSARRFGSDAGVFAIIAGRHVNFWGKFSSYNDVAQGGIVRL